MPFSDRPVSSATLPGPASSQREGVLGWHEWVAPFLSLCCFVHCVGMAVLAPLLPTALAFLGVNEQYDWTLWSMSAISVSFSLWVQRLQVTTWLMAVWGAGIVASLQSDAWTGTHSSAQPRRISRRPILDGTQKVAGTSGDLSYV
jgi:hypothetical protein